MEWKVLPLILQKFPMWLQTTTELGLCNEKRQKLTLKLQKGGLHLNLIGHFVAFIKIDHACN